MVSRWFQGGFKVVSRGAAAEGFGLVLVLVMGVCSWPEHLQPPHTHNVKPSVV